MLAENPLALRYILADDVYLLPADRATVAFVQAQEVADAVAPVQEKARALPIDETGPVVTEKVKADVVREELKIPKLSVPEQKPAVAEQSNVPAAPPAPQFNALGDNQKNVLVLVNYASNEFMAEAHLQALENAFSRLGYNRADYAILNIARYPAASFEQINGYFKPKTLIILGANSYPQGLPQQPFNQFREGKGGRKLLSTYSFNEMLGDKEKTRAYWEQMKNM